MSIAALASAEPVSLHGHSLLAAWFSPSFPVGAFAYSHGLETLREGGALPDAATARAVIEAAACRGGGRTDTILLAHAYRAARNRDMHALSALSALGAALAPSIERQHETLRQGEAFATLVNVAWPLPVPIDPPVLPHPVAVGRAGAGHDVPLRPLAFAYASGFAANLVSAAVRLVPLGQTDGQRITASLAEPIAVMVETALGASLDDIGSAAIGLDLASMEHETQPVRLYRS